MERKTRKKESRPLTEKEQAEIAFQRVLKEESMRNTINNFFSNNDRYEGDIVLAEMGLTLDTLGFAMTDYLELVFYAVRKAINAKAHEEQIECIREYLNDAPL